MGVFFPVDSVARAQSLSRCVLRLMLVLLPLFTAGQNDPRATGKCPSRQSATACYHLQLTVF